MATRTRRAASTRPADSDGGGGGLDRDYSGEEYREPGEGYNGPTPVKGLYPAKLVQVKDHESAEGNESIRWTFELTGGESPNEDGDYESVAGFRDHQYTNDHSTLWREQQIAVALGLVKPNGRLKMSFANILKKAKPCTVRIIRERYVPEDGGDPEWRAKISAVLGYRDPAANKKSTRRKADDAEDVFEEEVEEEVEEVEETKPRRQSSRSRRKAAEPEPEEDEDEDEEEEDEEEDEPEEGSDYDPDELAAELEALSLVQLKKRAREEFGIAIKKGMTADDVIEAVLDTLDEEDEEEEPEEEPEPPKRSSRRTTTTKKRGSQDPPF